MYIRRQGLTGGVAQSSRAVQARRAQRRQLRKKDARGGGVKYRGRAGGRGPAGTKHAGAKSYMHVCRAHGLGAGGSEQVGLAS